MVLVFVTVVLCIAGVLFWCESTQGLLLYIHCTKLRTFTFYIRHLTICDNFQYFYYTAWQRSLQHYCYLYIITDRHHTIFALYEIQGLHNTHRSLYFFFAKTYHFSQQHCYGSYNLIVTYLDSQRPIYNYFQ